MVSLRKLRNRIRPESPRRPDRRRRPTIPCRVEPLENRDLLSTASPDSLFVGDTSVNSAPTQSDAIVRFDAETGAYQGDFVRKQDGQLVGARGMIFNPANGDLLVASQNVNQPYPGSILQFN